MKPKAQGKTNKNPKCVGKHLGTLRTRRRKSECQEKGDGTQHPYTRERNLESQEKGDERLNFENKGIEFSFLRTRVLNLARILRTREWHVVSGVQGNEISTLRTRG